MRIGLSVAVALLCVACETKSDAASTRDSAGPAPTQRTSPPDTATRSAGDTLSMRLRTSEGDTAGRDSTLPSLRLADSARAAGDSAEIRIYPAAPQRGGVVIAVLRDTGSAAPRCTWNSRPLPCTRTATAVRAIIPLPADEPAGQFVVAISAPGVTARRTVAIADRDFGRQLVMLDSAHYAVFRRSADIARDARAVRQVLAGESSSRPRSGAWLNPAGGTRSSGYGVERFYFLASDSSRVMTLDAGARTTGTFGADTSVLASGAVPSWRHAGIDIPLARGAAARAAAPGTVADASEYILTGRTVIVDHGEGVHTAYFHLDTITVRRGDAVRRGERLGRVGSSGLATGPHLHYGVYVHGQDVDPQAWHQLPAAAFADSLPPPAAHR